MRELKVRAWDAIEGKMWTPILRPDGRLMAANQLGGYHTFDDPQDPAMLYSGLKDKSGVEICEGDILGQDGEVLAPITFDDGSFQIIPSIVISQGRSPLVQARADRLEIIGNIYENPELLEKDHE